MMYMSDTESVDLAVQNLEKKGFTNITTPKKHNELIIIVRPVKGSNGKSGTSDSQNLSKT
jgi:hypothetical protein